MTSGLDLLPDLGPLRKRASGQLPPPDLRVEHPGVTTDSRPGLEVLGSRPGGRPLKEHMVREPWARLDFSRAASDHHQDMQVCITAGGDLIRLTGAAVYAVLSGSIYFWKFRPAGTD